MKRPIKFRGKRSDNGEFVYGSDLAQYDGYVLISNGAPRIYVDPDSIAQLVGYDKDGNEVYEGDTVILPTGEEYEARLSGNVDDEDEAKLKE